nr:TPA_asm: P8 [Medicago trirhavirus 1]
MSKLISYLFSGSMVILAISVIFAYHDVHTRERISLYERSIVSRLRAVQKVMLSPHHHSFVITTAHRSSDIGISPAMYCIPSGEEEETVTNRSVPIDLSKGRYISPLVSEWNVKTVNRECYHDFLVRKWRQTEEDVSDLSLDICKESDQEISTTNALPQCTMFSDGQSKQYIGIRHSATHGEIKISQGRRVLLTPRSEVFLDSLSAGVQFAVYNKTCVKFEIIKRSMCTPVHEGKSTIRLSQRRYNLIGRLSSDLSCFLVDGGFEICECDELEHFSPDLPQLGDHALQLELHELEYRTLTEARERFCQLCKVRDFLDIHLKLECYNKSIYHITLGLHPISIRFQEGRLGNDHFTFDPETGLFREKGDHSDIAEFGSLPPYVYVVNTSTVLNCSLVGSPESLSFNCSQIWAASPSNITELITEYSHSSIFDHKFQNHKQVAKEVAYNFLADLRNIWNAVAGWFQGRILKLIVYVSAILVLVFGVLWYFQGRDRSVSTVRILPRGTTLSYESESFIK